MFSTPVESRHVVKDNDSGLSPTDDIANTTSTNDTNIYRVLCTVVVVSVVSYSPTKAKDMCKESSLR